MRIGIITGSGTYALPGFEDAGADSVDTPFGPARVTQGTFAGRRRAARRAPRRGPRACSPAASPTRRTSGRCASAAPTRSSPSPSAARSTRDVELGSLIVFDDLHFLANRLPDGSLCTLHTEPGAPGRGHWIFDRPFARPLRAALLGRRPRGRASGARRRLLRPRRRPALQHAHRDPRARARRRDRGVADRRARDRPGGRGQDPLRAARLRDRLRQRRQARRADAGRGARAAHRGEHRDVRPHARRRRRRASRAADLAAGRHPFLAGTEPARRSSSPRSARRPTRASTSCSARRAPARCARRWRPARGAGRRPSRPDIAFEATTIGRRGRRAARPRRAGRCSPRPTSRASTPRSPRMALDDLAAGCDLVLGAAPRRAARTSSACRAPTRSSWSSPRAASRAGCSARWPTAA